LGNNKNAKISIAPAIIRREKKDNDDGIRLNQTIGTLHNTNKNYYIIAYFPFTVILVSDTTRGGKKKL
jgi:hypothetical protein